MLPGLRIVKRLEQQNKNNKKLQCSLANWLFLAEASKKDHILLIEGSLICPSGNSIIVFYKK